MQPRISVLTLAVEDLDRAVAFYRDGLGWPTGGVVGTEFENGAVAFFEMGPALRLALWPRASLAADAGLTLPPAGTTAMSLGHNVASRGEVDTVMAQAAAAGARVVKPAGDTFWGGYAGYFSDPDGHLWEVVHNPEWPPRDA
ncbi:MAG TPA: VOC family protein [Lysobacter sp.]